MALSGLSRRAGLVLGLANLVTAALLSFGVFVALPARWWPVDTVAAGLAALQASAGVSLLATKAWAAKLARLAAAASLAVGLLTVSLLAVTASWLSGVYGPVGKGGAIVLALVLALAFPYLVVSPAAQLAFLRPSRTDK